MVRNGHGWTEALATVLLALSCRNPNRSTPAVRSAAVSAEGGISQGCPAPTPEPSVDPACPPLVNVRQLDRWPKKIPLEPPREPRSVVFRNQGVTVTMGRDEFVFAARCMRDAPLVEVLVARPAGETSFELADIKQESLAAVGVWRVVAALLELGRARVHDDGAGQDVESVTRVRRDEFLRISRASGRDYFARTPGQPFLRVTDMWVHYLLPETSGVPGANSSTTQ